MPIKSRCPECGSVGGWNLYEEPGAWDDGPGIGAFVSTCLAAIFHPQRLARHVWCPERLDLNAARRFRRFVLTIASLSLMVVAFIITLRATNIVTALVCLPIDAM